MAGKCSLLSLNLLYCILDLVLSTVLFIHGNLWEKFSAVYSYTFTTSFFDLWCFAALRFTIILGAILAIAYNTRDSVLRVKKIRILIYTSTGIMIIYSIGKMLICSELIADFHLPWFWSFLSWTWGSSVLHSIAWNSLSKVKQGNSTIYMSLNSDPGDAEETRPLLHPSDEDEDEDEETKDKEVSKPTVRRLLSMSKPDILYILLGFIGLLVCSVGEIFIPLYEGMVIDSIVVNPSHKKFTQSIIILIIIASGSALGAGLRGGMFSVSMARLGLRIRRHLFQSITRQEIGFFDVTSTGDITSRLTSDTTTISDTVSLNVNVFLRNTVKIIGYVIFMATLSWRLTIITLIGIPLIAIVSKIYGGYYQKLAKQVQDTLARANQVAEEVCSSMKTVRSFANEDGEYTRYSLRLNDTYAVQLKEATLYTIITITNRALELAMTVLLLYYGGHLVIKGTMTAGKFVSFLLYEMELEACLEEIGDVYTGLMQAVGAAEKVFEWIDRKPLIQNDGKLVPKNFDGGLEFKNISFFYPSRTNVEVLKNVSFKVEAGEVVALVGPSGGGKSSCVNLIEHFYEAQSGSVLLDSIDIREYSHKYLHSKIALVGQEPVLYANSLEGNIGYGLTNCKIEQVVHAAKMANAHGFITELPGGYDTQTGEKGLQLSGGQKQRVAIARAIIRGPEILLLDEATSALDAESEHIVQQAIYDNMKNKTVLIIAHRLSTVEKADRIIVINKGEVVEEGNHQELLGKGGLYSQLVKKQLLGGHTNTESEGSDKTYNSYSEQFPSTANSLANSIFDSCDSNSDG